MESKRKNPASSAAPEQTTPPSAPKTVRNPLAGLSRKSPAPVPEGQHLDSGRLQLLVTVVNKGKGESTADLLQAFEVNMQMSIRAEGTASTEMLEILGMDQNKKSVVISVIREEKVPEAMAALEQKFARVKDGKGIAFTLPMSSIIGAMIFGFLSNDRRTVKADPKGEKQ